MRLARVLGAIGRGLISAGVIVLLFVAYQLWGTGLQHQQAQGSLENELQETFGVETDASDEESLAALAAQSQEAIDDGQILASDDFTISATDGDEADAADPGAAADDDDEAEASGAELLEANFDEDERQEILAKLYPEPGEAFARIVIPAINVDQISVEGVSVEDLRKGPGHYQSTPNPGQAGNAAIAGHRTTYGAPFHRVDELVPGDSIFVTTAQGTFQYKVKGFDDANGVSRGHFIVAPSETWVLGQETGENLLTLTACHPKYSARQRIIVQAELVGEPAPTIPRDEAIDPVALSIDSGSSDERAAAADGVEGEVPEEEELIISEEVAIDDDPDVSIDEDGNIVDSEGNIIEEGAFPADAVDTDETDPDADEAAMSDETEAVDAAGDSGSDDASVASSDGASTEADLVDDVELSSSDAELTSAQTPFGAADDFGEGLNGDPTKVKPAIMWGMAGLAIWAAAGFMGYRLDRKWTLYAMGLVPFGFTLWSTFVNVDQALPSY